MRNAPNPVGWVGVGRVGGKLGYWLSCSPCFSAEYSLLAKGCGVLCAEMGVAWHILGIVQVSDP